MLKPERKAQWCGHDDASEFGPPGLSAAVHVWGSDPVPPLWGSNPGLPDQLWACYSHVRAPCREDRLGGLWSRSGSGHKLDRSTGATAACPRRDRKWLLAARGTAGKLFLYVTRLRLCVGAAHRASQDRRGRGGTPSCDSPGDCGPEHAPSPPLRRRPRRMAQRAQARRDVNDPASSGHLWPRTPTAGQHAPRAALKLRAAATAARAPPCSGNVGPRPPPEPRACTRWR